MIDTAERVLPLQGGRNFRDMGGYPAADGRQVRWGQLFRSGSMAHLTAADHEHLSRLGIRSICDLRNNREREREPTRWLHGPEPRMYARDYGMHSGKLAADGLSPADARDLMLGFYEELPYSHAESYRALFAELLAGHTPLLFNCSAGKDRTGVAGALVLSALGVPREIIVADYALTETLLDYDALVRQIGAEKVAVGFERVSQLAPEIRRVIMRSEPAYLEAGFAAIETNDGSVNAYLEKQMGVGAAEMQTLRDLLLA